MLHLFANSALHLEYTSYKTFCLLEMRGVDTADKYKKNYGTQQPKLIVNV